MSIATILHDEDAAVWQAILAVAGGEKPAASLRRTAQWRVYAPLLLAKQAGAPFVIGQIGQSLDGRCATVSGHSHYINGQQALLHLHRLRALVDAVVVGVGTALADDPQLTVRHAAGPQPARVVIDPSGRLPAGRRCLADDGVRCLVVRNEAAPGLEGAELVRVAATDRLLPPRAILAALRERGLQRVLIEGGPQTLSHVLAADCLDRLHMLVGPMIIGSGRPALQLPAIERLDEALRPETAVYSFPGGDLLFDCALR